MAHLRLLYIEDLDRDGKTRENPYTTTVATRLLRDYLQRSELTRSTLADQCMRESLMVLEKLAG